METNYLPGQPRVDIRGDAAREGIQKCLDRMGTTFDYLNKDIVGQIEERLENKGIDNLKVGFMSNREIFLKRFKDKYYKDNNQSIEKIIFD